MKGVLVFDGCDRFFRSSVGTRLRLKGAVSPLDGLLGKDMRLADDVQIDVRTGTETFAADGFNLDRDITAGHVQV
ncbi:hypothetical protein D3C78_1701530 [compost metagenome]